MHEVQRDVAEFHRVVVGIPDGEFPAIRRGQLRADLIMEEAGETAAAATGRAVRWFYADEPDVVYGESQEGAPSLVGVLDGLCDLLCVTYGAGLESGVDLAPFWAEVHRTNMAKAGGPVRADGKRLKPDGWMAPDIAGVLFRCYGVAA